MSQAVSAVSKHVVVMEDANARTGRREDERTSGKMTDAYGRDKRNDNRRRMGDLPQAVGSPSLTPVPANSNAGYETLQKSSNRGKEEYRLICILTRRADLQMVRNVSVWRDEH